MVPAKAKRGYIYNKKVHVSEIGNSGDYDIMRVNGTRVSSFDMALAFEAFRTNKFQAFPE